MTFAWKTVIADQGFAETCQVFNEPPRGLLFVSQRVAAGQLPITNYQLPITNYQLPITNYQLPITNYQLPITASFLQRTHIPLRQSLCARLQHAAHDLSRTRLGEFIHELDILGTRDRSHMGGDVLA